MSFFSLGGARIRKQKARREHVQPPDRVRTLADVAFGSDAARELAEEAGLGFIDFARSDVTASGADGYLVGDVRKIMETRRA